MKNDIGVFLIDAPWPKKKGGIRSARPAQGRLLDYETLSVPDIFSLLDTSVFPQGSENHTVFMWSIDEFLHQGEKEMTDRGYRRHARFVWDKENGVAPAFTVRFTHEYLTWFYKPKFTAVSVESRGKLTTVFREKARQHSRKPEAVYQAINLWFPNLRKLDVFSREPRVGWDQFGDQVNHFTQV
jgi:N6-adenosine-specific RNA methylase IME4